MEKKLYIYDNVKWRSIRSLRSPGFRQILFIFLNIFEINHLDHIDRLSSFSFDVQSNWPTIPLLSFLVWDDGQAVLIFFQKRSQRAVIRMEIMEKGHHLEGRLHYHRDRHFERRFRTQLQLNKNLRCKVSSICCCFFIRVIMTINQAICFSYLEPKKFHLILFTFTNKVF